MSEYVFLYKSTSIYIFPNSYWYAWSNPEYYILYWAFSGLLAMDFLYELPKPLLSLDVSIVAFSNQFIELFDSIKPTVFI